MKTMARRLPFVLGLTLVVTLMGSVALRTDAQTAPPWAGTWLGTLSGQSFQLDLWETFAVPNARITFTGYTTENLSFLGRKTSIKREILYFWRPSDQACISIYPVGDSYGLGYFEADAARTTPLTRPFVSPTDILLAHSETIKNPPDEAAKAQRRARSVP